MGEKFDEFLAALKFKKAPEKDQPAAFSTIWFGLEFFSKTRELGYPKKKWSKLREVFREAFLHAHRE